jgi:hypothetical protein
MGLLQRSYRIGFFIAVIAATVFVVAGSVLFMQERTVGLAGDASPVDDLSPPRAETQTPARPILDASLTVIISGVTCLVSTLGAFSTMLLSWRLDRRQSRETELRIAQLQIEVERSRQVKVDQS